MSSKLKSDLSEQMKVALKGGDKDTLMFARNLHAIIRKKEIDERKDITDEEFQKVVATSLKQRKESIEQFEKGGRADLVAKEQAEANFLETFLPPQLSDAELVKLVEEAIQEAQPQSAKDLGKVMKVLMPKVQGRADGKKINQFVRDRVPQG